MRKLIRSWQDFCHRLFKWLNYRDPSAVHESKPSKGWSFLSRKKSEKKKGIVQQH
jgi:hypothetical protein